MTDPFEHLLRSTLSEIAEEAPTVQDPLSRAERQARNRRRNSVAAGAAGIVAALMIATPFAFADSDSNGGRPSQPANTVPMPSPSEPGEPVPSPSKPGEPVPSPSKPGQPMPSPSNPGVPMPSPSESGVPMPSPSNPGQPIASPSPR